MQAATPLSAGKLPYAAPADWTPISPDYDPWDPIRSLRRFGRHRLTSVELTVTQLCNMRCEHCAVGDSLTMKEAPHLPLDTVLRRLDEIEHLETISLTGGEPTFRLETVRELMIPVLKYARARGVRSQLNSNVTLDYGRYDEIAPYLDVMHISFNYTEASDFHRVGFARSGSKVSASAAARMYERMMDNVRKLADGGLFVSAESMINFRTAARMPDIHRLIVEMGCLRHEVHPMYPSSFAADLPMLTREQMREAVETLLDARNKDLWMLFGTLPFFACSDNPEERRLVQRLRTEPGVTVRGDPDGRNRVNVNMFSGDVYVTDFASIPPFGNIRSEKLEAIFDRWQSHPLQQGVNCHCPEAACCGPNLLVSDMYYKSVDFRSRRAQP
ncbi:radical SAM/CxCxxxxC motif protein YfkAB [Cohnella sp. CFH 77786]|uniref:radical SAM/CxCxxxxC motif protein YfkAB n=1 Tax=Cohnella sp. CFH 77786 TaxID=2662265 RepID=UPI001C60C2E6|nr:radical SAM/CxCxxxxC motif protein YfkAB [Cohnella sp. CFH 77786]MBW5447790.1 radical SAM/CxCxxxxC motif protein YfkAB [Cohnella sp. CFH 77786]